MPKDKDKDKQQQPGLLKVRFCRDHKHDTSHLLTPDRRVGATSVLLMALQLGVQLLGAECALPQTLHTLFSREQLPEHLLTVGAWTLISHASPGFLLDI